MRKKITNLPLQPALQRGLIRMLGEVHAQANANLQLTNELIEYVTKLDARTAGLSAVAKVVDENEEMASVERQVGAAKELIAYTFREAHSYVVIVVAAGYAAYFTTLSVLSDRLEDGQLYLSALLMTSSLTIFILWEIFSMAYLGWLSLTNRFGQMKEVPRWYKIAWPIALGLSLVTALPAIGLSGLAYLEGLQPTRQMAAPSTSDSTPSQMSDQAPTERSNVAPVAPAATPAQRS